MKDTLRIGIFGGRRGAHLGKEFMLLGCSITAVCETRKNRQDDVSFITGWMVLPNGKLKLNTPYGGK